MITLKLDENRYNEIKKSYEPFYIEVKGEYKDFVAKVDDVIITGYLSKHHTKKVTFDGKNAEVEASKWGEVVDSKKEVAPLHWVDLDTQIGSDEVGVGDFLLPMIVVATYLRKQDISFLKELGVRDSKKLNDQKILEIGEILTKKIEYSKLTLNNEKYNEMIEKGENINSLKAKMHNRALHNLVEKHPDTIGVYVDQFVSKEKFYEYLNDPNEVKVKDVSFRTKGESLYPSVAAASVIARYAFLKEVDALNAKYKLDFPFGAGTKVNEFAKKFIDKYGLDEFKKIAKLNFANYKELTKVTLI